MAIFYVSPTGSDSASGSSATTSGLSGPFATLARAQQAMEASSGPNTTYIEAGTYSLASPVSLTAADSNDSFIAMPGAAPVVSSGTAAGRWTVTSAGIWQAHVSLNGVTQFTVNGMAQTQAQYPDVNSTVPVTSGWLWAQALPSGNPLTQMAYNPSDFPAGPPVAGEQVTIFTQNGYASNVLTITSVNTETGVITFAEPASYAIGPGSRYFVSGGPVLPNQPGTWSFNAATQTVSYLPPAGFNGTGAVASDDNQSLFSINGASNVTIQGLTLTNVGSTASASWGVTPAVYVQNASGVTIAGNTFTNDAEGVYLAAGTSQNTLSNNTFSNIAAEAINLAPTSNTNLVTNNTITGSGAVFRDVGAIQMTESANNVVSHNLIQNVPRFGIEEQSYDPSIPSGNNTIEYNQIFNTGQQTADTGSIYLFAAQDPASMGDIIAYNDIVGTGGLGTTSAGFIAGQYLSWGIYLDNYVSNAQVYGNFVSGTADGGVMIHGGNNNKIYNNVLLNNAEHGIELLELANSMSGTTIYNNLVQEPADTGNTIVSLNPAFVTPSKIYSNIYVSPSGVIPYIANNTFAGWQAAGGDAGSSIVASAGFVNPATGNYTFAAGSAALADGIPQLPWSLFGPTAASPPVIPSGTLSLVLSEDAYNGDAQFVVKVDGAVIGGPTSVTASAASGATQTFTYSGAWGSGGHAVEVDFVNDLYGGSALLDRNLYVDQVQLNGVSALPDVVPMYSNSALVVSTGTSAPSIGLLVPSGTMQDYYGNAAQPWIQLSNSVASDVMTLSLSASGATLAMTGSAVVGSGTGSVSVSGTQAQVQSDLATLIYTGTATGAGTLSAKVSDTAGVSANAALNEVVSSDTISLSLSETAYQGNSKFIVTVNGSQVGATNMVTASHAAGASQTFNFTGNWGFTPIAIDVDFINGLSGHGGANTRTLYINQISYNGAADMPSVVAMTKTGLYGVTAHPIT